MSEKKLFEPFQIRGTTVKNRICVPPMFSFGTGDKVESKRIAHYRSIAAGGSGLIIVEATCVADGGQLHPMQLGIWDDSHIDGLRELADAIHQEGGTALIQIHHAGVIGSNGHLSPDDYVVSETVAGQRMTIEQIGDITQAFIQAGRRACEAGFDGVELHGAHAYLISQFLNKRLNKRDDIYGQKPEKFVIDILKGIRELTPDSFIVGIRLGAFEPTLEDGMHYAKLMEQAGFDFLNISYGFAFDHEPTAPADFPCKDIIYAAAQIKMQSAIPVFAVGEIRKAEQAQDVLRVTDVDMVNIGRATLADYTWASKARANKQPVACLGCKKCGWFPDGGKCPGRLLAAKADGKSA